jgi:Domain of unknown function (DUF3395)
VLGGRFLAEPGKLVLHQGVRKAGLMGFCDVAPGEMKHLRVAYLSAGRPHVALLTDLQVGSESQLRRKAACQASAPVSPLQHLLPVW